MSKDKPKTKTTIKNAREKPDNKKKSSGGSVLRDVMVYPIIIALAFAFIAPLVTYFISGRHAVLYATAFGISVLLFLGAHALNTYLDERNGGGPTSASQNRKSLQSPMDRESAPPRFRLVAHAEFKDVGIHTPYANFMALFTLNGFETLSPIDAIYELTLINLQKTPAIIDWYTLSCNPSGDDTWVDLLEIPQEDVDVYDVDDQPWAAIPITLSNFRGQAINHAIQPNDEVVGNVLLECPFPPKNLEDLGDSNYLVNFCFGYSMRMHIKERNGTDSVVTLEQCRDPNCHATTSLHPGRPFKDVRYDQIVRPFPQHVVWGLIPPKRKPEAFDENAPQRMLPTPKPRRGEKNL